MAFRAGFLHWSLINIVGIMFLIQMWMNITLLISVRKMMKRTPGRKAKIFVVLSIIPIILYGMAVTAYLIVGILVLATNDNITFRIYVWWIPDQLYLVAQPLTLFIFTVRLDITFENTKYHYSKCIMYYLYFFTLFLIFFCVILIFLQMTDTPNTVIDAAFIVGLFYFFIYFIFSFILIFLFIRKLNVLAMETANAYTNKQENDEKEEKKDEKDGKEATEDNVYRLEETVHSTSTTLSATDGNKQNNKKSEEKTLKQMKYVLDKELLYNITKNGLLIPMAISLSLMLTILAGIVSKSVDDEHNIFYLEVKTILVVNATIYAFCIFCLFPSNDRAYFILCGSLHILCEKCQLRKMKDSHEMIQVINDWRLHQEKEKQKEKDDTTETQQFAVNAPSDRDITELTTM